MRVFLLLTLVFGVLVSPVHADSADRDAFLNGVSVIAAPGLPGTVCAYGPSAFPVTVGSSGGKMMAPVVAASRWDKGRVVVFGHTDYLGDSVSDPQTGQFVLNALRWAGDAKPRVGVRAKPRLLAFLQAQGITALPLDDKDWTRQLGKFTAIACPVDALTDKERRALASYIQHGGGLLASETGWGWRQIHEGKSLTEFPGNLLLEPAGLGWTDGTLSRTAPEGFLTASLSNYCQASEALSALLKQKPNAAETAQAVQTIADALQAIPLTDTRLRPQLASIARETKALSLPVTAQTPLARLAMTLAVQSAMLLPADKVQASRLAADFPGAVAKSAPRISKFMTMDTSIPEWHSTGLYAAPGEHIAIIIPQSAAHKGLQVRIGAHTDTLWNLPKWERAPEITRAFPLNASQTVAANAFGGLIYIVAPEGSSLGSIAVTIQNAVQAPYFVRGQTNLAEWRQTIRNSPAPWAELQGNNVILTVPSSVVKTLDAPEALMDFWDRVLDAYADLVDIPRHRPRPERYCTDRQISAGYMHSGYPIMTGLDVAPHFVDLAYILSNGNSKAGSWGFFHEMGHNHQVSDWTFDGTGEVTNNVLGMYILETLCGITKDQHPAIMQSAMDTRLQKYLTGGANFEQWKSDPFLALTLYIQLQKAFGWDTYKKVFAEYRTLPQSDRPKTDAEKRDQWMVRFSRAAGRNLGPFFQAWGVPTSPEARASIANLPAWMPSDWPTNL